MKTILLALLVLLSGHAHAKSFDIKDGADIRGVIDMISNEAKKLKDPKIVVQTQGGAFTGAIEKRTGQLLVLVEDKGTKMMGSGQSVARMHFIPLSSILGITIETFHEP